VRWGLVLAAVVLASLGAAASGSSQAAPNVRVTVTPSAPRATSGTSPLGQREFTVTFHVTISSDATCENLSVTYTYGTRFNGRPSLGENVTESFDSGAPATSGAFDVQASASPAETIAFNAQGSCEQEDGTVLSTSGRVTRTVRIPAHSCEQGPLRVLAVRGSARRGGRIAVRAGHYVRVDDAVSLGRRSSLTFGAPECRGFRVTVASRRSTGIRTGAYSATSRGFATVVAGSATVGFRGDRHSGGLETPGAIVLPRTLARFSAAATSRTVTTVRVRSGTVAVAPRLRRATFGKRVVVRAGHGVRCAARVCR
jgi:hypothetical protein